MVCSACGYENQAGNRFCGMCGTPLPHRPMTTPGAHGTHTLTRVPLENASLRRESGVPPSDEANAPAPPRRGGVLIEMPAAGPRSSVQSTPDMVPEVPLDEYVKGFRYVPPSDPDETTMRGEAGALRPEAPVVADAPPAVPVETTATTDANPVSASEDVRERLGLDEATPEEERHDRPRFLDFSEPASPGEEPKVPVPAITGPSFLGLNDTTRASVPSPDEMQASKARGSVWTWIAVAALLGFVALGVLEWRSQINQTNNGPVEVVKMKLRNIWRGYSPTPRAPDSAGPHAVTKPATQVEEQSKPQAQGQDVPANPNAPNAAVTNSASPAAIAANTQQNVAAMSETQPPAGQKIASPTPGSYPAGAQPTTTRNAADSKPAPPPDTTKVATAAGATEVVQSPAAKPKPKPQPVQEADRDATAKNAVPGEEELAKANNASDAAAAAAWLWKATAKGNPQAPVRLADMYAKGEGVPRSCEQALVLLQAAADKGNAQARARLTQINNSGACAQRTR